MKNDLPTGTLQRALAGTKTAAKVGSKVLGYYAKRPFLSPENRLQAKEKAATEGAGALFQGLGLLKGTALKMAQQLSLEADLLPEAACRELAKAYHQAPPINRALARRVVQYSLGSAPEQVFASFDPVPFAAASLGQVHRARTTDGREVAVKLQYPGIAQTITGDIAMFRRLLAPLIPDLQLLPTLAEIAARLHEEVDYLREAENQAYFVDNLAVPGVTVAAVHHDLSTATVLTTAWLPGKPLDLWLADDPPRQLRDKIAQSLNDTLAESLYRLHIIQADPNPGNFIAGDDGLLGLVDFGCVKRLDPAIVELYRQLTLAAAHGDRETHFQLMIRLGLIDNDLSGTTLTEIREMSDAMGRWYGRFFAEKTFDFAANPQVMAEGKNLMHRYRHLRTLFRVNPDLIFLDRTRYGLLRIFAMLGARVSFRNTFEWILEKKEETYDG